MRDQKKFANVGVEVETKKKIVSLANFMGKFQSELLRELIDIAEKKFYVRTSRK